MKQASKGKIQRSDINRFIAIALAYGGSIWALILLYFTLQFLTEGPSIIDAMFFNLLFFPGWAIYIGWWIRSFRRGKEEEGWRIFWIGSAIVNFGYFLLSSEFDSEYSPYFRGWWILAILLSLLALTPCASTRSTEVIEDQLASSCDSQSW